MSVNRIVVQSVHQDSHWFLINRVVWCSRPSLFARGREAFPSSHSQPSRREPSSNLEGYKIWGSSKTSWFFFVTFSTYQICRETWMQARQNPCDSLWFSRRAYRCAFGSYVIISPTIKTAIKSCTTKVDLDAVIVRYRCQRCTALEQANS